MNELPAAVQAFRALFEQATGDMADLLSEDIELRPPSYGKSWSGRDLVCRLLSFAALSFGGLGYTQLWGDDRDGYVLRFEGVLDGKPFSGVDVIHLDAEGRIARIEIFARPPPAMLALRDRMGEHIRHAPEVAALMDLS